MYSGGPPHHCSHLFSLTLHVRLSFKAPVFSTLPGSNDMLLWLSFLSWQLATCLGTFRLDFDRWTPAVVAHVFMRMTGMVIFEVTTGGIMCSSNMFCRCLDKRPCKFQTQKQNQAVQHNSIQWCQCQCWKTWFENTTTFTTFWWLLMNEKTAVSPLGWILRS